MSKKIFFKIHLEFLLEYGRVKLLFFISVLPAQRRLYDRDNGLCVISSYVSAHMVHTVLSQEKFERIFERISWQLRSMSFSSHTGNSE